MIHFDPPQEPATFDADCRQPGLLHLQQGGDYWRDFWSEFRPDLAEGFNWLCGYSGVRLAKGTVDHYRAKGSKPSKSPNRPELAYDWSNYRFADSEINNGKRSERPGDPLVLDPFEVQDGWFEIAIPSLRLKITNKLPAILEDRAKFTLDKLKLRDGSAIMRLRQDLYSSYVTGHVSISHVRQQMPLLAKALVIHVPPEIGEFRIKKL